MRPATDAAACWRATDAAARAGEDAAPADPNGLTACAPVAVVGCGFYPPPPDAAAVAGLPSGASSRLVLAFRAARAPPLRVRCRGAGRLRPPWRRSGTDPAWAVLAWPPVGPGPASSGGAALPPVWAAFAPAASAAAAAAIFRSRRPPGLPPCSTPISRTRPCPSTWRARSCSARRVPSQARVRGPYLPLHSSIRGRAGQTRRDLTRPLEARSSQRLHRVLISVVLSSALSLVGRAARVEQLDQRSGVRDAGEPQRPPEGATPLCQREAVRIGVQMCPPPR